MATEETDGYKRFVRSLKQNGLDYEVNFKNLKLLNLITFGLKFRFWDWVKIGKVAI